MAILYINVVAFWMKLIYRSGYNSQKFECDNFSEDENDVDDIFVFANAFFSQQRNLYPVRDYVILKAFLVKYNKLCIRNR